MSKNSVEELDVGFSLKGKVYFIFQQGDDKRCKIGKSVNPSNRKDQLQTGNPDELYVYKTLVGYSSLESTLHKKFKEKRIRNTEWFYLTKEEVDIVIQEYTPVKKFKKSMVLNNSAFEKGGNTKKVTKNVICEKCNKGFEDNAHLKRHLQKQVPCDKIFKCEKCEKVFPNQSSLSRHDQRKTECIMTEIPVIDSDNIDVTCHMCGNTYASASNLRRHKKNCPVKNDPSVLMDLLLKSEQKRLDAERAQFNVEKQLFELQKTGVAPIQINNINTVNNIQQNMYVNVTICNFGSEDLNKLNQQDVINILKGQVDDFMTGMIDYIYANPNHPERHNIFYDPVRQKVLFQCKMDDKIIWKFDDIEHVSKLLTDRIKDHMQPLNSPYFNTLAGAKDIETANKIPQILCTNWNTPKTVEGTKTSLSKVTKNEGFMDKVKILE